MPVAIAPQKPRSARGQVARVVGGRGFTSLRRPPALLALPPARQGAPGEVGGQAEQLGGRAVCGRRSSRLVSGLLATAKKLCSRASPSFLPPALPARQGSTARPSSPAVGSAGSTPTSGAASIREQLLIASAMRASQRALASRCGCVDPRNTPNGRGLAQRCRGLRPNRTDMDCEERAGGRTIFALL